MALAEEGANVKVTTWRLLAGPQSVPLCCVESVAKRGAEELEVATKDGRRLVLRFGQELARSRAKAWRHVLPIQPRRSLEPCFSEATPGWSRRVLKTEHDKKLSNK